MTWPAILALLVVLYVLGAEMAQWCLQTVEAGSPVSASLKPEPGS